MKHYRKPEKGGGLFSAIEHQQAVARKTCGILKLHDLIAWENFRPLLEEITGYAGRDWSKGGKPPFDPLLMFKVLVLQKFHGLSDAQTEEQIFDRSSFKNFLGLQIGDDIPDVKTLRDFKQRIEEAGREGSIVDASFVEAPRQRNDRDQNRRIKQGARPEEFDENPLVGRQKDSEARWTKKNQQMHFGWKFYKGDLKVNHWGKYAKNGTCGTASGVGLAYDDSSWRSIDLPHDFTIKGFDSDKGRH